MAAFFISLATVAIAVGVVVLVEWPNLESFAKGIFAVGFVAFIIGFAFTIRDEIKKHKEEKQRQVEREREETRRQLEYRQRDREHDEYLLVLGEIAKRLGARISLLNLKLKRQARRRKAREDYKDDDM